MSLAKLGWLTRETEDKWLEYEQALIKHDKIIFEIVQK